MNKDSEDKYYYNVREKDGKITVEKIVKEKEESEKIEEIENKDDVIKTTENIDKLSEEVKSDNIPTENKDMSLQYDSWYNIKEENGSIYIEKKNKKDEYVSNTIEENIDDSLLNDDSSKQEVEIPVKKKKKFPFSYALTFVVILFIFLFIFLADFSGGSSRSYDSKERTFIIYMTGSDLESDGSIGTYDLNDITDASIDLNENNVILMVGGSIKWHNFVNEDELGIYELTNNGFEKKGTFFQNNMGSSYALKYFLDYVYEKYPANKFDLLFWDHGLGTAGIEHDEQSDDYLAAFELNEALGKSPFANKKLELVIFNNCLAANYQFAKIMSNYADYMVASEEVLYVSKYIDRLNFIEDVSKDDNGYDVGLHYIEQSDESLKKINKLSVVKYDSTLSIIDLSKISALDENLNKFFASIDLKANLNSIAKARSKTYTYGSSSLDSSYDVVDMYNFIDSLKNYSTNEKLGETIKTQIKSMIKYNSSFNFYSNGISIYFPYFGESDVVETHLMIFDELWDDDYTKFINDFYDILSSTKKSRRVISGSPVNYLKNKVQYKNNIVSVTLTDEEKDIYQTANIYIFEKNNDSYKLLLKTDNIELENNVLKYNHYGLLNIGNNNYVSLFEKESNYTLYGAVNNSDIISDVKIEDEKIKMNKTTFYSEGFPSMGIVDVEEKDDISFYSFNYNVLQDGKIREDWKEDFEKENIEYVLDESKVSMKEGSLKGYYVLVEMYDINNDTFYTELTQI